MAKRSKGSALIRSVGTPAVSAQRLALVVHDRIRSVNVYLGTLFFLIWIFIGIFFMLLIYQSLRQGVLDGLFGVRPQQQVQGPQEANLPGVGRVNVDCVQKALSNEALQKVLSSQGTSQLSDDEKNKLEGCIIAKETATPSATPSQ